MNKSCLSRMTIHAYYDIQIDNINSNDVTAVNDLNSSPRIIDKWTLSVIFWNFAEGGVKQRN